MAKLWTANKTWQGNTTPVAGTKYLVGAASGKCSYQTFNEGDTKRCLVSKGANGNIAYQNVTRPVIFLPVNLNGTSVKDANERYWLRFASVPIANNRATFSYGGNVSENSDDSSSQIVFNFRSSGTFPDNFKNIKSITVSGGQTGASVTYPVDEILDNHQAYFNLNGQNSISDSLGISWRDNQDNPTWYITFNY